MSSDNYSQMNKEYFNRFINELNSDDEKAWENLNFVLKRIVIYWLSEKVNNSQDIEYIYNETFLTFYKLFKKCKFESFVKLKSFILSIADKKLKESFRKQKLENRFVDIDESNIQYSQQNYPDIEQKLEIKNLVDLLLSSLSKVERKILYGYFHRGEKLKEIAENIEVSEENCRLLKHRALKKLQAKLIELEK